jgi:hypothetical protein
MPMTFGDLILLYIDDLDYRINKDNHLFFIAHHILHVYLHREPHYSGPFDMQLVYEDMPQESGSYQCRAAHISANGYANG